MSGTVSIAINDGWVCVTIDGDATVGDIIDALDNIRPNGNYISKRRLWDFRKSRFDFSAQALQQISGYARKADLSPGSRVAMLVDGDLSFGVSMMYRAFRESQYTDVRVFRNKADAISWLGAEDGSPALSAVPGETAKEGQPFSPS